MKQTVIAFIAALAFVSGAFAQAGTGSYSYGKPYVAAQAGHGFQTPANPVALAVGSKWGPVGAEASYARSTGGEINVNQWGVTGSYDLYTYSNVTFDAKLGAVYVQPSVGLSGWQATYGIGATLPLSGVKNTSLTTSYVYQNGQSAVNAWNGGTWNFGAKYQF